MRSKYAALVLLTALLIAVFGAFLWTQRRAAEQSATPKEVFRRYFEQVWNRADRMEVFRMEIDDPFMRQIKAEIANDDYRRIAAEAIKSGGALEVGDRPFLDLYYKLRLFRDDRVVAVFESKAPWLINFENTHDFHVYLDRKGPFWQDINRCLDAFAKDHPDSVDAFKFETGETIDWEKRRAAN